MSGRGALNTVGNHIHTVDHLYGPVWASAVQGCKFDLPEGVDPDNLFIIAGFTCHSCLGPLPESRASFSFDENEYFNEDNAGCSCADGSSCITWDAIPVMVDLNEFIDWQYN